MAYNVFVVAGEASADIHAASLVKEFKRLHPNTRFFGVGGPALEGEGVEIIVPSSKLSVVGISDWLDRAGEVFGAYRTVKKTVLRRRPDLAVLLDLPDFNLNIAKHLKKIRTPIAYYISPQVWAWRKYRVKKIQRLVDQMMVVFPFEKDFYAKHEIDVEFVGHPLLEQVSAREEYRSTQEILRSPRVAILPGSRKSEIRYHDQILKDTIATLLKDFPYAEIKLPVAPTLSPDGVKASLGDMLSNVSIVEGKAREVMAWADVALVASGTATLECALIGTPFCLFYKASPSSAWIFKNIVRYRNFIGMPNLLLEKEIVKEFFQEKACAEALSGEVQQILQDAGYREQMIQNLARCRSLLGVSGASQRAAYLAHRLLLSSQERRRNTTVEGIHAPVYP